VPSGLIAGAGPDTDQAQASNATGFVKEKPFRSAAKKERRQLAQVRHAIDRLGYFRPCEEVKLFGIKRAF
jgi:hypothetical protein